MNYDCRTAVLIVQWYWVHLISESFTSSMYLQMAHNSVDMADMAQGQLCKCL